MTINQLPVRLPAGPLRQRLRRWMHAGGHLEDLEGRSGVTERTLVRILSEERDQTTVTLNVGDRIAIALELHPAEIWPGEWTVADDEPIDLYPTDIALHLVAEKRDVEQQHWML